ncbi:MAG: sulfatase-like hydrolase/transferase, partial [Planctomycetaceae bacterium]|nr:sulfatase-like hydrolase/transferase [Planctomycetaceae bacterium]
MSPVKAASADRPNIVIILADDQGYGDFSLNGNPWVRTPHIDSLAKEGARFERFYVNSFCAPTRAALLTGRYPVRCGVWGVTHNHEAMRPSEVTIAEAFKASGYRTACIGKWHNGEQFPFTPPGQGFDEFFGFHNGHINNYFNTKLIRNAHTEPTTGYITDVLTNDAIRFIIHSSSGENSTPFFCYVPFNAPHSPYQVPDQYYDRFRKMGFDESVSAFWGMCENIDDNVGRLLKTLDDLRIADNTIVVFLTDNGGTAGVKLFNAGMRGGKTSVHEGGCRVPMHIRWPNHIPAGRVVQQIASHIDIYP